MPNNVNISPVISPDILKNISSSTAIKTFGEQLKNKAKEKIIAVALGKVEQLKNQIEEIVKLEIKVWSDYNTELKRLEILLKEKQITQEQYDKSVAAENVSRDKKLKDLANLKAKLSKDLANIVADPYRKIKNANLLRKRKRARRKARNKAERAKARRDLAKKVIKNAVKTLIPIIALQLAGKLASILSQRAQLEKLVDQVNLYIENASTPEEIQIATNLRNNTIALINNSINKLDSLSKTLQQISLYITIFSALVAVLSSIAIPTAVPPGIGVPVALITRITKALERANKLIASLGVLAGIGATILENEVLKLNELIERLKQVSLDDKALSTLNQQELTGLTSSLLSNTQFPPYKGFRFQIKEEQNPSFEVKGNKRHYAVAIDSDGVEVLKSELSFTLDPQDLVDQLKLIIDQRNLQG